MVRRIKAHDTAVFDTDPGAVWEAITDFSAYPDWWPPSVGVRVLEDTPEKLGSAFEVTPYRGRGFRCTVDRVSEGRELGTTYSGLYRGSGVWEVDAPGGRPTTVSYTVDLEIDDRLTRAASYVLPVARLHSRLMRSVFRGLAARLATGPSRSAEEGACP